jgi:probable O-glycosylation ligase (exosortase A-associated)
VTAVYGVLVTISYLASVENAAGDLQYDKFWKELVLMVLITGLMYTRHRLHQVLLVVSIALGFYMAKEGLIFLATAGGHNVEGSSSMGDNNGLALAILMTIPLLLWVASNTGDRWIRLGMYITAAMGAVTVIATYSRGGFVGMIALGLMLLKGNKYKVRSIIGIAIAAYVLSQLMPQDYVERINTIKEASDDQSFMTRLVAWKVNLLLALDHPFLGGGPYASLALPNWFAYVAEQSTWLFESPIIYRTYVAHSIYFQVLGDTGFVGLFLFMSMIATALVMTIRTQRRARKRPDLAWAVGLARAIQISIVVYLVCGAALSNVYFELLYIVLAVTSRTHRTVVEMTAAQNVPARAAPQGRLVPAYGRAV